MSYDNAKDLMETDSVDAWAAGEYSEDTLNLVRGYQKPDWLEEPSVSLWAPKRNKRVAGLLIAS